MRTVVITGANVGIGFAAARFLAASPDWHVLLACRNPGKAKTAIDVIRKSNPKARAEFVPLDLLSLASVRRLPSLLTAIDIPPIGGLILNAGGINMKAKTPEFTEDGFEKTFQLNFLGHFLLANLMIKHMTGPARIIYVSSDLHDPAATRMGKVFPPQYGIVADLARGTGTAARLKPMARYGTSKMYALMIAYELDRKLKESGRLITVNSWSPGVIPTTQAGRDVSPILKMIMMSSWFVSFMGSHLSTEEDAGRALGGLLTDAKYSGMSGKYFDGFREIPSSAESRDESKAQAVWEQSIKLAGLSGEEAEYFSAQPARGSPINAMQGRS